MTQVFATEVSGPGKVKPVASPRAAPSPRPRRVALLQTQAEAAGAQEISRILGQGLQTRGYDVHQVFFFRRTSAFDHEPNTVFCMLQRPKTILSVIRMFFALVRHLKRLRPDAVICFQHYGNIIGAFAARLAGVRTIVANRTSAKSLLPRWLSLIDLVLGSMGLFSKVIVNSRPIEEEYHGYPRGYRSRVLRVDHGFETKRSDLNKNDARRAIGLPINVALLGSVARLHPGKNLSAAIRLLALDDHWHLALVGQGEEHESLAGLAKSLGVLARVHFIGELPFDRIGTFLRSLDVFVFPTLAETFGLAAVEAAQAGIPVVANDLEVLREVLAANGKPCALFVDACNIDAFADAVRRCLTDKDLRELLTSRGGMLSHRYSLDVMVNEYAALIECELLPPFNVSAR